MPDPIENELNPGDEGYVEPELQPGDEGYVEPTPGDNAGDELNPGDEGYVEPESEKEPTIKDLIGTIGELTTQVDKANKRTQYLQRKMTRGQTPEKLEPAKAKPDESDFETNAEYIEALTDYKVDQRERVNADKLTERQSKEREEDFYSVIDSGAEKYKDFNEVARKTPEQGGPTINESMLEAMTECKGDLAIDVAYYLGQNVKESVRISNLSPIGAAREIGKIEAQFSGDGKKVIPQKIKTKTTTPSKPVEGKTSTDVDLNDLSTDEFMKSRNANDGVG